MRGYDRFWYDSSDGTSSLSALVLGNEWSETEDMLNNNQYHYLASRFTDTTSHKLTIPDTWGIFDYKDSLSHTKTDVQQTFDNSGNLTPTPTIFNTEDIVVSNENDVGWSVAISGNYAVFGDEIFRMGQVLYMCPSVVVASHYGDNPKDFSQVTM